MAGTSLASRVARLEIIVIRQDTMLAQLTARRVASSRLWQQRNSALRHAAEQLWQYLWREQMPPEVSVSWVPYLEGQAGRYVYGERAIRLDWSYAITDDEPLDTLLHEMAHARGFDHGREMTATIARWRRKCCVDHGARWVFCWEVAE